MLSRIFIILLSFNKYICSTFSVLDIHRKWQYKHDYFLAQTVLRSSHRTCDPNPPLQTPCSECTYTFVTHSSWSPLVMFSSWVVANLGKTGLPYFFTAWPVTYGSTTAHHARKMDLKRNLCVLKLKNKQKQEKNISNHVNQKWKRSLCAIGENREKTLQWYERMRCHKRPSINSYAFCFLSCSFFWAPGSPLSLYFSSYTNINLIN